ncbi:MAG TPA: bifunctional riboflavin kinase/FAD synthetase [Longilinea sp.]|nr:bifunctional riboflavin kinase/FAD synthetase [Longilinea sp.]
MRRLVHSFNELQLKGAWATIGSFDGVHRGHKAILTKMVNGAHAAGAQAVVITFSPHPAVVLRNISTPYSLTSPSVQAELLFDLGVDVVVNLPFDKEMVNQSAEEFMQPLCEHLGLACLVIGHDFALGRNRKGDFDMLTALGKEKGFCVSQFDPVTVGDDVVSSSLVRSAVQKGEVERAAVLLGRWYFVDGMVVHGDGRGRSIGIPTANLDFWKDQLLPPRGVYATLAQWNGRSITSVTNIGARPTFNQGPVAERLEAHLLGFDEDLYGKTLRIVFLKYLRPEVKFSGVTELLEQVHKDIAQAQEVFTYATTTPGLPA